MKENERGSHHHVSFNEHEIEKNIVDGICEILEYLGLLCESFNLELINPTYFFFKYDLQYLLQFFGKLMK